MLIRRIIIFLIAFLGLAATLYAGDVQIKLKPGLNYISIPNGTKRSAEEVLSALPQSSRKAAYYDTAQKKYLFFVPDTDYREFSEFEFLRGYWVKNDTAGDVTLTISGTTPNAYSVVLKAGWNAIGCPGDKEISVEQALSPLKLGEDYSGVWRYVSNVDPWYQKCAPSDQMIPGEGYWIKMIRDMAWKVNNNTVLSISLDNKLWDIGTIAAGKIVSMNKDSRIIITNDGTAQEALELKLSGPPGWSASASTGDEKYVLSAIFCGTNDSPQEASFNQEGADDVILNNSQKATASVFAYPQGTANGAKVASGEKRALYLQFKSPTITKQTEEQVISVIVTAQSS